MFAGFVDLESTIRLVLVTVDTSDVPTNADAFPTFRVYGPNGLVESDTAAFLESGSITGATNVNPIVITSVGHGLTTGARVTISGVGGNTNANGTFEITVTGNDTFSVAATGNGGYSGGGVWHVVGLYVAEIEALGASGYEAGENYAVLYSYELSSAARGQTDSFGVV